MVDIVTPTAPAVPTPALASPPAITKIDIDKLAQAAALIAPLIPKSWLKSSILLLSIVQALQLSLAGVAPILPVKVTLTLGAIIAIVIGVLRVVQANPPIAGGPQDLTTGVKS